MALTDKARSDKARPDSSPKGDSPAARVERRGGDHGGRRPVIISKVIGVGFGPGQWEWLCRAAGAKRGSRLVRTLVTAATGLDLTPAEWEDVARNPEPFRDALREVMSRP